MLMKPIKRDDDYIIQSGKVSQPPYRPKASIAALSWAAEREGLSYGQYCLRLRSEDEIRVQLEFDDWKRTIALERAERARERQINEPIPGGFIIREDD